MLIGIFVTCVIDQSQYTYVATIRPYTDTTWSQSLCLCVWP